MKDRSATEDTEWCLVARLDELPTDGSGLTVEVGGAALAVFRVGERVHVLDDTCPHEGASLGCGVISRGDVTCPWHGWHFSLEDGSSSDGLPDRVRIYATRLGPEGEVEARLAPN